MGQFCLDDILYKMWPKVAMNCQLGQYVVTTIEFKGIPALVLLCSEVKCTERADQPGTNRRCIFAKCVGARDKKLLSNSWFDKILCPYIHNGIPLLH